MLLLWILVPLVCVTLLALRNVKPFNVRYVAPAFPWVLAIAALFLIPAASLAGIPPLSGFWAKLAVIRAAVAAEAWVVLAAALAAGMLTLLSMVKIWNEAFWKAAPTERAIPCRRPIGAAWR